ncbi:MAG: glycerol-3-phosphate dehydrogenase/oxidase [Promethearchaeota archaeon]
MESSNIFNPEWTYKKREKYINRLKTEKFDLIIIGGGITGAGIAREAALRGIKTALVDKNDFAFGTSGRSSKLVHGGLRYLSQGKISLVRESTTERNWLRNHFPNLVRPLLFNLNSYKGGKYTPNLVKIAMRLYDLVSNFMSMYKNYRKSKVIPPEELIKEEPAARTDGLLLTGQYYDNNVDDARLTLETIKESIAIGDIVAVNYVKIVDYILESNKIIGVKSIDLLTNTQIDIYGIQVVNATGIWTEELLKSFPRKVIRPSKGVHVVVKQKRLLNNNAFVLRSIDDGRVFFIIRRGEISIIGTTDTDYNNNLDEPFCSKEDCDYLFRTVNEMFPNAHLTYEDIISTYAGIRPLVIDEKAKNEGDVSRKHVIFDTDDGLTTIAGGKLTIFRKMGEDVIFHLIKKKKVFNIPFSRKMLKKSYSKVPFLIGLERSEWDRFVDKNKPDLPKDILDALYQQYGRGVIEIVQDVTNNSNLGKRFLPENQFIPAEINYILKYEFAPRLIDVLCRRTEIALKIEHTRQHEIAEKVAKIMARIYGWDENQKKEEINYYLDYISKTIWF